MALNRKHDVAWDELIQAAAAEIKQLNPHIGRPMPALTDEEYAQALADMKELERVCDEIAKQHGDAAPPYTAADAVDEDRGE